MTKPDMIRECLDKKGVLVMPGVYDALSAKIAARAGFEVIFITGYSLSACSTLCFGPGSKERLHHVAG